jgi:hypothetical protein
LVCGNIICIAVAGDFGGCDSDYLEGECRKALYESAAATVKRLFLPSKKRQPHVGLKTTK